MPRSSAPGGWQTRESRMGMGMVGLVVQLGFFFGGGVVISGVVKRLCNGSEGAFLDD